MDIFILIDIIGLGAETYAGVVAYLQSF